MLSFTQDLTCYLDFKLPGTQLQLIICFFSGFSTFRWPLLSVPEVNIQFIQFTSCNSPAQPAFNMHQWSINCIVRASQISVFISKQEGGRWTLWAFKADCTLHLLRKACQQTAATGIFKNINNQGTFFCLLRHVYLQRCLNHLPVWLETANNSYC